MTVYCTTAHSTSWLSCENDLVHWPQGKGFSPTSMCSFVHLLTTSYWKLLWAMISRKRFITSMGSFVYLQITNLWKWLGALITGKWFLTYMCSFVHIQITTYYVCVRLWFIKLPHFENVLWHWMQINGFSPVWVLLYLYLVQLSTPPLYSVPFCEFLEKLLLKMFYGTDHK